MLLCDCMYREKCGVESPGACILYIGDSEEDSSDKKEVHMVAGYGRKLSVRNYYRQLILSHSFAQMLLAHFALTFAHLISGLTYVSAQILSLENWLMDYVPKSQGGAGTFSAQINTPSIARIRGKLRNSERHVCWPEQVRQSVL